MLELRQHLRCRQARILAARGGGRQWHVEQGLGRQGFLEPQRAVLDGLGGRIDRDMRLHGCGVACQEAEDVVVDDPTVLVAPSHAELGEDGVYRAENKEMTTIWLRGVAQSQKGLEILAEGLEDE